MGFLKKILTALGAFLLIFSGGAGTQSNSILVQGAGFILFLVGLVVLYIFIKMAWRAMGCLPSFMIFAGIICFLIYAIGGFKNGVNQVIPTLRTILGQRPAQTNNLANVNDAPILRSSGNQNSALGNMVESLSMPTKAQEPQIDIQNAPIVSGTAEVLMADVIKINGYKIYLYGVDAPELDQTCANKMGRTYKCGYVAATWLRDWLMNNPVNCKILDQDSKGNLLGICSIGEYDIGAALVNAGWAIVNEGQSSVYLPYQQEASNQRVGLWQGEFYRPQDWRNMKNQKPNIKITKPKKPRKSMLRL